MKKNLLILSIAAILTAPSAFADTASDTQTVNVTVPEVNLINVAAGPVAMPPLALTQDGVAGSGFATGDTVTSSYDFSGNMDSAGGHKNKITVAVTTGDIPVGGQLKITSGDLGVSPNAGTKKDVILTKDIRSDALQSAIGNVAQSAVSLSYTFGPIEADGMVGYTATTDDEVTLTYTISNEV